MQQKRQTKAEKHAATRAALLGIARTLFASTGYAETGTEDVVKQAGVTRGALYYHFADKRALFEAVVEQEAALILAAIEEAAGKAKSPLDALIRGSAAFLDACLEPGTRRIFLLDAPSVIGWQRWREIDAQYGSGSLRRGVDAALEDLPAARRLSAEALTYLLTGAMNEAALWLAEAKNPVQARMAADAALNRILELLFKP
ncbi:MAG TPA: TetR/AcrR family transcriptional regulator [Ferrovibrio sp.]|uniref:TetR/AcrR family transcriptional regulator n=1 Tax=Ferrovibrio sp. TaxID=1917215 RepID=UPI002B4B6A28|nr:TetR/AcrR family transcriptional regulator [Ferrovibrio sp.]HLT76428.1 TetR/AcrR family transcriptional regulator [Ferrovibrio sp.]